MVGFSVDFSTCEKIVQQNSLFEAKSESRPIMYVKDCRVVLLDIDVMFQVCVMINACLAYNLNIYLSELFLC